MQRQEQCVTIVSNKDILVQHFQWCHWMKVVGDETICEHWKLVLGRFFRNLVYYLSKRNKRCWHNGYVISHLCLIWILYSDIFACVTSSSRGVLSFKTLIIDLFNIFLLPIGLILKFCHGISNNLHVDITRCYTYWHKPLINCLVDDVIATYEELARCSIF